MASHNDSTRNTGSDVIVGGLFFQIIFFGIFVLVTYLFHTRMNKQPTTRSKQVPWKKHMYALYVVSALIMVRSIFRVVEFLQGFNGYIISHEWFLYVFDALLMLIAMLYMNWVHPSEIKMLLRGGQSARGFKILELEDNMSSRSYDRGYSSQATV